MRVGAQHCIETYFDTVLRYFVQRFVTIIGTTNKKSKTSNYHALSYKSEQVMCLLSGSLSWNWIRWGQVFYNGWCSDNVWASRSKSIVYLEQRFRGCSLLGKDEPSAREFLSALVYQGRGHALVARAVKSMPSMPLHVWTGTYLVPLSGLMYKKDCWSEAMVEYQTQRFPFKCASILPCVWLTCIKSPECTPLATY